MEPLRQLSLGDPVDTVSWSRVCLFFVGADTGGEDEGLLLVVFAKETLSGSFRAVVAVVEEIERFEVVVSYRS